jgi:dnd system-associated protein 4
MAANRIKIAKDKADLVKALVTSNEQTAPFQTYVEVLVFAAALGAKHKKRVPITEFTKSLDPIRRDYFSSNSCELTINLIAFTETQDHKILADDEISDAQRINIFEEYANGGLEVLQNELRGAVDYSERILLIFSSERFKQEPQEKEEFDLSKFLT